MPLGIRYAAYESYAVILVAFGEMPNHACNAVCWPTTFYSVSGSLNASENSPGRNDVPGILHLGCLVCNGYNVGEPNATLQRCADGSRGRNNGYRRGSLA